MCWVCCSNLSNDNVLNQLMEIKNDNDYDDNKVFDKLNTTSIFFFLYCNIGLFGNENRILSWELTEKIIKYLNSKSICYLPKTGLEPMYHPELLQKIYLWARNFDYENNFKLELDKLDEYDQSDQSDQSEISYEFNSDNLINSSSSDKIDTDFIKIDNNDINKQNINSKLKQDKIKELKCKEKIVIMMAKKFDEFDKELTSTNFIYKLIKKLNQMILLSDYCKIIIDLILMAICAVFGIVIGIICKNIFY